MIVKRGFDAAWFTLPLAICDGRPEATIRTDRLEAPA
jgi:hypothetical protein